MSNRFAESPSKNLQAGYVTPVVNIMVVDDDYDDAQLIKETIQEISSKYHITTINKSDEVLHMLDAFDDKELPSLIILDYNMPILSGLELLQLIKAKSSFAQIPIVVYSNSVYPKHKQECLQAGACLYLSKSATVQALRNDVEHLLDFCL